jgi:hypothetical protein
VQLSLLRVPLSLNPCWLHTRYSCIRFSAFKIWRLREISPVSALGSANWKWRPMVGASGSHHWYDGSNSNTESLCRPLALNRAAQSWFFVRPTSHRPGNGVTHHKTSRWTPSCRAGLARPVLDTCDLMSTESEFYCAHSEPIVGLVKSLALPSVHETVH